MNNKIDCCEKCKNFKPRENSKLYVNHELYIELMEDSRFITYYAPPTNKAMGCYPWRSSTDDKIINIDVFMMEE